MKLQLKNSVWRRGGRALKNTGTFLLSYEEGQRKQCCLGVLCTRLGVPDEAIRGVDLPRHLPPQCVPAPISNMEAITATDPLDLRVKSISSLAMDINDDEEMSDEEMIEALTPLFAQVGIELEFLPDE